MITPYASGARWALYQGDALEVLPHLRGVMAAHALLGDPPYSSGGAYRGDRNGDARRKYGSSDSQQAMLVPTFQGDARDQRAYTLWLGEVLARALDLLAPGSPALVFTDWRQIAATVDALQVGGLVYRGLLPWCKPDHACRPQIGRFRQSAEFVAWGSAGPWPTERPGVGALPGHYIAAAPRGEEREHITEKPADLLERLVAVCDPGGVVIDPWAGSGSTGEAALRTGRRFVGVEMSTEYCMLAARRLEQAERGGVQTSLTLGAA